MSEEQQEETRPEGKWYEVAAKFEVERANGKSLVEHTFRFWDVQRGQYDWGQTHRAAIRAGMELANHQGTLISASSQEMSDREVKEAGLDPDGPPPAKQIRAKPKQLPPKPLQISAPSAEAEETL